MKTERKLVELKQGNKSAFLLTFNNTEVACPFKQPIPKQNSVTGQVQVDQQPCLSNCPLFDMHINSRGGTSVSINCGGNGVIHEIDEVVYAEKLESKTLIL